MYKLFDTVINIIEAIKGEITLTEFKIQSGGFQGDLLSLPILVIAGVGKPWPVDRMQPAALFSLACGSL